MEEQEAVHLGEDQVRGQQRRARRDGGAECGVGGGMVLIARRGQRDPHAAIDENGRAGVNINSDTPL